MIYAARLAEVNTASLAACLSAGKKAAIRVRNRAGEKFR